MKRNQVGNSADNKIVGTIMKTVILRNPDSEKTVSDFPFSLYLGGIKENPRIWQNEHFLLEVGDGVDLYKRIREWVYGDIYKILELDDVVFCPTFEGLFDNPLFISEIKKLAVFSEGSNYTIFKQQELLKDEEFFWFEAHYWTDTHEQLKLLRLAIDALGEEVVAKRLLLNLLDDPSNSPFIPYAWFDYAVGNEVPRNLDEFIFVYRMDYYNE